MSTPKQIAANQKNGLDSTGPISEEGKNRSSLNALKLGLFARSALLPGENPKHLARMYRDLIAQFKPKGQAEKDLVDQIASVQWRLLRYTKVESGLFHLYRQAEGKTGNEAQAFAYDQKNLATLTKMPPVEGALDRKLEKLFKRLTTMQQTRAMMDAVAAQVAAGLL